MSKTDDGGQAFPINRAEFKQDGVLASSTWDTGMTLRDYFAGRAMQAILTNIPFTDAIHDRTRSVDEGCSMVAWAAYKHADAMLQAREA